MHGRESNSLPVDYKSDARTTAPPPSHDSCVTAVLFQWQWPTLFVVEEASHSQSETDDSIASPGRETSAKSSLAKATRDDEQSDDSTDVEDTETVKQNVVHVGDGDRADSMFTTNNV